jgi:hypothetical protein
MRHRHGHDRRLSWRQRLPAVLLLLSSSYARASDVEGVKTWQLGDPAPVGYHVARKQTFGIVGGSLLAGGYGFSVIYGLTFLTECYVPGLRSDPCHPDPLYRAAPLLFIPVAGPFLTLTNRDVRSDGGAVFWFSVFGTLQVAGAALLTYDLAVPHYGLKRGERTATASSPPPRLFLVPAYVGHGPGLILAGWL